MSTATELRPLSTKGPLVVGSWRKNESVGEPAYITGQIWSVSGGLDI